MDWIVTVVATPWFKILTFLVSFISLSISIWVFRKTMNVLSAQRASILSNQLQHANTQWNDFCKLILTNDNAQAIATDAFGFSSLNETRTNYFHHVMISPIFFGYQASKLGIMDESMFRLDLLSVTRNFRGDRAALLKSLRIGEYPEEFVQIFQKYLAEHSPEKRGKS